MIRASENLAVSLNFWLPVINPYESEWGGVYPLTLTGGVGGLTSGTSTPATHLVAKDRWKMA